MKKIIFTSLFSFSSLMLNPNFAHALGNENSAADTTFNEEKLIPDANFLAPLQINFAYEYIHPEIDKNMEDMSLAGFNLGVGVEFFMENGLSTTAQPSYSYMGGSENYFKGKRGEHDLSTNLIKYAQSLNYTLEYEGVILQPYGELALGYGWYNSEIAYQDGTASDISGHDPFWELGVGMRVKIPNGLAPFARLAYRDFDIEKVKVDSTNSDTFTERRVGANSLDFGGLHYLLGVGYIF
jgi:hypothetical protein